MVFVDRSMAAGIEAAEARVTLAAAATISARAKNALSVRLGAGVGLASGIGSPFDKVVGLGFEPHEPAALLAFERAVLARGESLRVELSTLAEPTLARDLTVRGYSLLGFENVLVCSPRSTPADTLPTDDEIIVRFARGEELPAWVDVLTRGFLEPDEESDATETFDRAALEQVFADMAASGSFHPVLALRGGVLAGGAGLRIDGTLAQLGGASTLRAHRRRGVQTRLLQFRLARAAAAGCAIATVTTEPGSRSQQNVMRAGFVLGYSRSVLVRSA